MKALSMSLAVKLGSVVVHADELTSPQGHRFDSSTLRSLVEDSEIQEWLDSFSSGLLPAKRGGEESVKGTEEIKVPAALVEDLRAEVEKLNAVLNAELKRRGRRETLG